MRVALLQFQAHAGDVAANLARIDAAAREAASGGAKLLVAPELATTGYGAGDDIRRLAEPGSGPQLEALARSASDLGIAIVAGFAERDGERIYNSAAFVDARQRRIYRKTFLYGAYEKALFSPGAGANALVDHHGLKIGVLVCYDVEFPEAVRPLARAGAELIVVPTALPRSDHAAFISGSVVPVRAFENQVHIAYADHCGADALFGYAGLSRVVAPDGATLVAADESSEDLIVADVEPSEYAAARAANPYLADLRAAEAAARVGA